MCAEPFTCDDGFGNPVGCLFVPHKISPQQIFDETIEKAKVLSKMFEPANYPETRAERRKRERSKAKRNGKN